MGTFAWGVVGWPSRTNLVIICSPTSTRSTGESPRVKTIAHGNHASTALPGLCFFLPRGLSAFGWNYVEAATPYGPRPSRPQVDFGWTWRRLARGFAS